jgi:hypothetical protein
MDDIPGWYMDAMEQGLGQIVASVRENDTSVQELTEMFLDPRSSGGADLTQKQHVETMALCLALATRRLAIVDVT